MGNDFIHMVELFHYIKERLSEFEKEDWENTFTIEFTHNSTAIEGNSLTSIETKMILEDHIAPGEVSLYEIDEICGHADAWAYVKEEAEKGTMLTENVIKDIHQLTMPFRGIGGLYRTIPVFIRGSSHVPPNPKKVRDEMRFLISDYHTLKFKDHIEKAAWLHAQFVKIHPFQDGNGRTARLLMNYSLLSDGLPPACIKKNNVRRYFDTLEDFSVNDSIQPFCNLLRENIQRDVMKFLLVYAQHIDLEEISRCRKDLKAIATHIAALSEEE